MPPLPLLLAAVSVAAILWATVERRRGARQALALRAQWGKAVERHRAFEVYRRWSLAAPVDDTSTVDDQTWADLDMDRVFAYADRTLSGPGRLVLYRTLRTPTASPRTLEERDRAIAFFSADARARDDVRSALAGAGRLCRAEADLAELLWGNEEAPGESRVVLAILGLLGATTAVATVAFGGAALLALAVVFTANVYVHQKVRIRHQETAGALAELGALLRAARSLARVGDPSLDRWTERIRASLRAARPVLRPLALVSGGRPIDLLYEYVSVLLLLEAQALPSALRLVRRHGPALRDLFLAIGEIDALQSTASLRAALPRWTKPSWIDGDATLVVDDAVHPLVEDATPNSVVLGRRGCLVTGMNMAGKSTFLRTLGVNALLARTLCTCTCARYEATPLRVLSSMAIVDSLEAGESLFLAEGRRLLDLVRATDGEETPLCLIDEMLAGTNATDRAVASRAILEHLAARGAIIVAATHDPDLAESLIPVLDSYHFGHGPGDASAPVHRLHPGLSRARNALGLLETLGYPAEVLAAMGVRRT